VYCFPTKNKILKNNYRSSANNRGVNDRTPLSTKSVITANKSSKKLTLIRCANLNTQHSKIQKI